MVVGLPITKPFDYGFEFVQPDAQLREVARVVDGVSSKFFFSFSFNKFHANQRPEYYSSNIFSKLSFEDLKLAQ